MKSFLTRLSIALMLVFVVGQVLGTFAIQIIFLQSKVRELEPQLQQIADEIAQGNFNQMHINRDFILKAYDLFENEIPLIEPQNNLSFDKLPDSVIKVALLPYSRQALSGKSVARITTPKGLKFKSIIIGVPIIRDGSIVGTVFVMKPASDFGPALNGFYIVNIFTGLLGALVIFLLIYRYQKATLALEQTRRDYVANISHELRSPITSVKALAITLADGVCKEEEKISYYQLIVSESERLERLISDILVLSRLQSGKEPIEKTSVNGVEWIRAVVCRFQPLAQAMGICFFVTDSARSLPVLNSNEARINQVLTILIDNAFKFTPSAGSVVLDARVEGSLAHIQVRDTGVGIPESDLPYVFDRFFKSEKSHNHSGSGLGLSIAKELLSALGEQIIVSSKPGTGTIFEFTVHLK